MANLASPDSLFAQEYFCHFGYKGRRGSIDWTALIYRYGGDRAPSGSICRLPFRATCCSSIEAVRSWWPPPISGCKPPMGIENERDSSSVGRQGAPLLGLIQRMDGPDRPAGRRVALVCPGHRPRWGPTAESRQSSDRDATWPAFLLNPLTKIPLLEYPFPKIPSKVWPSTRESLTFKQSVIG